MKTGRDLLKAEMSIKRATSPEEMFKALHDYMEAHIDVHHSWPVVIDIQRRHFKRFKKVFNSTSVLETLMNELLKDPTFPLEPLKPQGKGPYLLMPNLNKSQGTDQVSEAAQNSDIVQDIDDPELAEFIKLTQKDPKTDKKINDPYEEMFNEWKSK